MEKYKILTVEDDGVIAEQMKNYLEKWGYTVVCVKDFRNVLQEFVREAPHIVLLDIGLPYYDGYYWCEKIRQVSQVPILFVSSAGDNMNIVMAVNMGGDDFVAKPFEPEILGAKIQALIRRAYAFRGQTSVMEYHGILLDLSGTAIVAGDKRQTLTKNEFRIVRLLFENPERTISREAIMKRLWDNDCFVDDNTLTVNMTRLRKKLEALGMGELIHTRRGMGYCLAAAEECTDGGTV